MKNANANLFLTLGLALWFFPGCEKGAIQPRHPNEDRGKSAGEAAKNTLKFLSEVIDAETFAGLGFRSLDEVKAVELGAPIPLFRLRCDTIIKRDTSLIGGIRAFSFSSRILYPLTVGGVARASFIVDSIPDDKAKNGGDWLVSEIGNAALTRMVDSSLRIHAKLSRLPESSYTVAEIPDLGQAFLVYPSKDGEMVVPLEASSVSGCRFGSPGQAVPLAAALDTFSNCKSLPKFCRM
jgi:hypothetical protein